MGQSLGYPTPFPCTVHAQSQLAWLMFPSQGVRNPPLSMCSTSLSSSSVGGLWGCLGCCEHGVHVPFGIIVFSGYMPGSGIAGSYNNLFVVFWGTSIVFHGSCTNLEGNVNFWGKNLCWKGCYMKYSLFKNKNIYWPVELLWVWVNHRSKNKRYLMLLGNSFLSDTTATAKSLQSCPTLCDPIDVSPPGSSAPAILQARTLEWVAISFSNAWKWKSEIFMYNIENVFQKCTFIGMTMWVS